MNLWGVQLGMRNSGSKISEFLKTPQVFGMSHAGQASAQAQKCPHLHRLLTKAFPTSKDFTTKCLSPLSWFSLPGWILIFFFPSPALSLCQLMEEHQCVEHIQNGICVPGKDLVLSAPSSSDSLNSPAGWALQLLQFSLTKYNQGACCQHWDCGTGMFLFHKSLSQPVPHPPDPWADLASSLAELWQNSPGVLAVPGRGNGQQVGVCTTPGF